jgi:hypothetical protein
VIVRGSSFVVRRSAFVVRGSAFVVLGSAFGVRRSSFVVSRAMARSSIVGGVPVAARAFSTTTAAGSSALSRATSAS